MIFLRQITHYVSQMEVLRGLCGLFHKRPRYTLHSVPSVRLGLYVPMDGRNFEIAEKAAVCRGSTHHDNVEVNVINHYCNYGNHTAGSKPILKLFTVVTGELNKVSLCQK